MPLFHFQPSFSFFLTLKKLRNYLQSSTRQISKNNNSRKLKNNSPIIRIMCYNMYVNVQSSINNIVFYSFYINKWIIEHLFNLYYKETCNFLELGRANRTF